MPAIPTTLISPVLYTGSALLDTYSINIKYSGSLTMDLTANSTAVSPTWDSIPISNNVSVSGTLAVAGSSPVYRITGLPGAVIYSGLSLDLTTANAITYFDDIENINLTMSSSDNNMASTFTAILPNEYGRHKDDFVIGNEVKIYVDQDINPPTSLKFTGIVENVDFNDKGTVNNQITLTGRDYSALMQNITIKPTVFNSLDAGSIVKSLVTEFCSGLTTGSILDTGKIVNHIGYNHTPVYDGVSQLAEYVGYQFYVDPQKNVNFLPRTSELNSFTLGSANVTTAKFKNTNKKLFNQIWVYGDRVLSTAPKKLQTSDGIGSVIQLDYNPHNIEVSNSGTNIVKGGIFHLNSVPSSGTFWLVDYDNAQIIWTSGTYIGNNVPASGTISTVYFDRSLPIVKYIQDNISIEEYGVSTKVINDKNIKDPRQATDIAKAQLKENAYPREQGTINVQGIVPLSPSMHTQVYLPYHDVSGLYNIFQVQYNLNAKNNLKDEVMTISVGEKIPDVSDTLKQTILDLRRLQAADLTTSDILTRIEASIGSVGFEVDRWYVKTVGIGSDWYVGSPTNTLNSWIGSPGSYYVGSHSLNWTIQYSGGE